jgi:hypothetical protein
MKAIARRSGDDMLSSTIIVTTEPGLVKATARPRPAITGISVDTALARRAYAKAMARSTHEVPATGWPEESGAA